MTPHECVEAYIPLVDFLAAALGESYEVVLHDLTGGKDEIIAIRNNTITGRSTSAEPENPYMLEYFQQSKHPYIVNYSGRTKKGRYLRSSTFFIKNGQELLGLICINFDITPICEIQEKLEKMISKPKDTILYRRETEDGNEIDIGELVEDIIERSVSGLDTGSMNTDDKRHIVEQLSERGVFLYKGALADVAKRLDISLQTLYRYLKETGTQAGARTS